jgi:hypothetical protein
LLKDLRGQPAPNIQIIKEEKASDKESEEKKNAK